MDNNQRTATIHTLPARVADVAQPEPQYDPYTYLPMQRGFFMTSNFTPMPDKDAAAAAANPPLATHINAMWQFLDWMRTTNPQMYDAISNSRPDLVDASGVVLNGKLSVNALRNVPSQTGLSGLADANLAPFDWNDLTSSDISTWGGASTTPSIDVTVGGSSDTTSTPSVMTEWGTSILSTLQTALPAYFQAKSQSDLMTINIKRAEQGLPPIDSSTLAPTVNVGVSPAIQQLGYIAVGGLVLVGLYSAFAKSGGGKKRR